MRVGAVYLLASVLYFNQYRHMTGSVGCMEPVLCLKSGIFIAKKYIEMSLEIGQNCIEKT